MGADEGRHVPDDPAHSTERPHRRPVLHKVLVALAAIPVLLAVYLTTGIRRTAATRIAVISGTGAMVALGVFAIATPRGTEASPRLETVPLPTAAFRPIVTGQALASPFLIDFTAAMDRASVEASLQVVPEVDVSLTWSPDSRHLEVRPADAWLPTTLHTLTIDETATAADGGALGTPVRAAFLTRPGVSGTMRPMTVQGDRAAVETRFVATFDGPVDVGSVMRSLYTVPHVAGTWTQPAPLTGHQLLFTPSEPLEPGVRYTFAFTGALVDVDGVPLGQRPMLTITTEKAPRVVRFRPRDGWKDVERGQVLSVRFSRPMERTSTAAAFSVLVNGKPIAGRTSWAEKDTVLVFDPVDLLPYGAAVTMRVSTGPESTTGVPLTRPAEVSFTVEKKPAPKQTTTAATSISRNAGNTVGKATWYAVEVYYLRLMNCTRGGGYVTSGGDCSSPGGSGLSALKLDAGISSRVARPYARRLAISGSCTHFLGGTTPGTRLKAAGYTNYAWAENIGCRSGDPYRAVLGSHRYFQSEKSYNGGHWRNMMNSRYDRVGIGVWVSSGRVRLVVDFYHP